MTNNTPTPATFIPADDIALNPDFYFNREELAETFGLARSTVCKMIRGIPAAGIRDRGLVFHISDVCTLQDKRLKPQQPTTSASVENNPDKMTPPDRRTHYQAEDTKQAAELKRRKNELEERLLIPATEVEQTLAHTFKTVALTLDTLPDALERDGLLASADVDRTVALIDDLRSKLAEDLMNLEAEVRL